MKKHTRPMMKTGAEVPKRERGDPGVAQESGLEGHWVHDSGFWRGGRQRERGGENESVAEWPRRQSGQRGWRTFASAHGPSGTACMCCAALQGRDGGVAFKVGGVIGVRPVDPAYAVPDRGSCTDTQMLATCYSYLDTTVHPTPPKNEQQHHQHTPTPTPTPTTSDPQR